MRLSRASLYALHALCFLARQNSKESISTRAIAAGTGISVVFLLKALKPCVDRQLLASVTGPRGGYRLAKPARRITVLEVIEAVDGPLLAETTFHGNRAVSKVDKALTRLVNDATRKTRQVFAQANLAKLAGRRA
jgi:Rrf2 family protein